MTASPKTGKLFLAAAFAVLLTFGWACGGGGGGDGGDPGNGNGNGDDELRFTSINSSDSSDNSIFENTVVKLSFTSDPAPPQTPEWSVERGELFTEAPADPELGNRQLAQDDEGDTAVAEEVFWRTPAQDSLLTDSVAATVRLPGSGEDGPSRTKTFDVVRNPLSFSRTEIDPDGDGNPDEIRVDVSADNVNNFRQAAFRVYFDPQSFTPREVEAGDFIDDPLFFSVRDQDGFVPVAVSVKQGGSQPSGSGTLASVILKVDDEDSNSTSSVATPIRVEPTRTVSD